MPETQLRHGLSDTPRLIRIKMLRQTGRDVAERAGPGADLAHDHHRGMTLRPAFPDIGTCRFLADRHQPRIPHERTGLVIDGMVRRLDPDPGRFALDRVVRPVRLLRMPDRCLAMIDGDALGHGTQIWSGPSKAARVASCMVSEMVGCGKTVSISSASVSSPVRVMT